MLKIETAAGYFDHGTDFTLQIDETNPVMNDRGSQSVPATVPCTPNNAMLTGFAYRLDAPELPMSADPTCTVSDGAYCRRGRMNVVSASRQEGITFNIGFDNAEAYARWQEKMLPELSNLPKYGVGGDVAGLLTWMGDHRRLPDRDFSTFRIVVENPDAPDENDKTDYRVVLNNTVPGSDPAALDRRVLHMLVDNTPTDVTVPAGYGYTGFLHVWRVLELVFADLELTVTHNPFSMDPELKRLVILNNCADACCTGVLDYADLMPDCTVETLLNALHVRFGMVYSINYSRNTVDIRLIRDLIESNPALDLTQRVTDYPKITYNTGRYITLAAKSSFDGATPESDRFEDFTKETGTDSYCTASFLEEAAKTKLIYLPSTGEWYKWDELNDTYGDPSPGFFKWDPRTPDMEPEELTSDDEWVPVKAVGGKPLPFYLAGAVNRHSFIKGKKRTRGKDSDAETPLAFLFSFTDSIRYDNAGSFSPYFGGSPVQFTDGSTHTLSLLFQFRNGLFDRFWKKYDEILRHGFSTVEIPIRMPVSSIATIDMLRTVALQGQMMLIDTFSYSLPADNPIEVEMTLRTLRTLGVYDIEAEQGIPRIGPGSVALQWEEIATTFHTVRDKAAQDYLEVWRNGRPDNDRALYFADSLTTRYPEDDWKVDPFMLERAPAFDGEEISRQYSCDIVARITTRNKYGSVVRVASRTFTISYFVTLRGIVK